MSSDSTAILAAAFQAFAKNSTSLVFVKDAGLVYVTCSPAFARMTAAQVPEAVAGRTDFALFPEALARRYTDDDRRLMEGGEDLVGYVEPLADEDGKARYGATSKHILRDEGGAVIGLLGLTRDITREYLARQHYQQELRYLFELPADTYAIVYIDVDDWRIISQRRQLIEESTLQSAHTVEALLETALASIADPDGEAAAFYRDFTPAFLRELYASGRSGLELDYTRHMPDGSLRWVHNEVRFLTDPESGHLCVMLTARDIDGEKREEHELFLAARTDRMTRLLNREATMDSIRRTLDEGGGSIHALFMLDVDNFKALNDTLGHQAGDAFLTKFAGELRRCFRESDVVGRIGGDEFFALMKCLPDPDAAREKGHILLEAVRRVCASYPPALDLSCSVGVSLYPEHGATLEELYARADEALYRAKHRGKNQVVFA